MKAGAGLEIVGDSVKAGANVVTGGTHEGCSTSRQCWAA